MASEITEPIAFKIPSTKPVDFSRPLDESVVRGKTVIITGGASGIGLAAATALARNGAAVFIHDLNDKAGVQAESDLIANGGKVKFIKTDVSNWDSQLAAFKETLVLSGDQLDIVIACAGLAGSPYSQSIFPPDRPLDAEPQKPSTAVIETNLFGVYFTTALTYQYIRKLASKRDTSSQDCKPQLLIVASLAAYLGQPDLVDYSTAKFGVRGMFKTLFATKEALLGDEMQVNMIAPAYVATPMIAPFTGFLKKLDAKVASLDSAAAGIMRCVCDPEVEWRSVCVLPEEKVAGDMNIDLHDHIDDGSAGMQLRDMMYGNRLGDLEQYFTATPSKAQ